MKAPRLTAILLAGGLFATSTAHADEDLQALLDEPIVSTSSHTASPQRLAPATTSVITAEDLRRHGIRSLDEAINYASLGMTTANPRHAQDIGSRGVLLTGDYGNHVLLLVDGHAMNEPWNGTAYYDRGAVIPFELVDHIEVSLGPGSVTYGSQAMLGVLNIITKRAKDYRGVHLMVDGEVELPNTTDGELRQPGSRWLQDVGSGYRLAGGIGEQFELFGEASELTLQAEYYEQRGAALRYRPQFWGDDWVTGEPKRFDYDEPTGVWGGQVNRAHYSRVPALYSRWIVGDTQLAVRAGMYERGIAHLDSLVAGSGTFDDPKNKEIDYHLNLDLSHRVVLSRTLSAKARAYADVDHYLWRLNSAAPEDCSAGQNQGCERRLDGVGRQLGGELQLGFDWLGNERLLTTLGIDARVRQATSEYVIRDLATDVAPEVPGGNYSQNDSLIAPYLEQIARPLSWLELNLGLRGDFDSRYGHRASPRTAAAITPWEGGTLKVIYAEAFRAPTSYELNWNDPSYEIASPDLKPETVRSAEASLEQRFGGQRLLFGVFRSWWSNMVTLEQLSDDEVASARASGELVPEATEGWHYANAARIENYGFNAAYEGTLIQRRLHYALNLTSAHTRIDPRDGSTPLPPTVTPQLFGNARISYDLQQGLPTLGLAAYALARRPADRAFDGGFAEQPYAPARLELRATISGPAPGVDGLSYRVSATYATSGKGAYVVGPNQYPGDNATRAELTSLPRLSGFVGLQYDFDH